MIANVSPVGLLPIHLKRFLAAFVYSGLYESEQSDTLALAADEFFLEEFKGAQSEGHKDFILNNDCEITFGSDNELLLSCTYQNFNQHQRHLESLTNG